MAANQSTLSAILKEFYLGPVQEQLNNEMLILQTMEKSTVDWNGRVAIIPVHIARNRDPVTGTSGVAFAAEGGNLPTAGAQGYARLEVNARFLYGRFQITGPAMSAAGKGGANSFIGWMDAEMNKLVTDVKDTADRNMISGGRCVGFINERHNNAAAATYEFFGDIAKLETIRAAVAATVGAPELRVDIVRMDTYAANLNANGDAFLSVASTDATAGTFTAGAGAAGTMDLSALPAGVACAVIVSAVQDGGAGSPATVAAEVLDNEPLGVFGNIGLQSHFGVDRTTAGAGVTGQDTLQSTVVTQETSPGGAGAGDRADISLTRIQGVLDEVLLVSGKEPNVIFMNPVQRQKYAALFQLTAAGTSAVMNINGEKAATLNGGFSGLAYGSLPIKTSRHVPNGGLIFLRTDTWKILELEAHAFADIDGDVLLRVQNQDSYEGYYRWYYNTVCTNPNQNAILAGLTLV